LTRTRLPFFLSILILLLASSEGFTQAQIISGTILSQGSADPVADVTVHTDDNSFSAITRKDGTFRLETTGGVTKLFFDLEGFRQNSVNVGATNSRGRVSIGTVFLVPSILDNTPDLDRTIDAGTVQQDDDNSTQGGTVSSLLTASRDPFQRAAAFNFNATRFRIRGYDNRYTVLE